MVEICAQIVPLLFNNPVQVHIGNNFYEISGFIETSPQSASPDQPVLVVPIIDCVTANYLVKAGDFETNQNVSQGDLYHLLRISIEI